SLTGNFFLSNNTPNSVKLSLATVSFSGGGNHTNRFTSDDLGNNGLLGYPDGFTDQNSSYGKLSIGATDQIYFGSAEPGASSNALYVLLLELPGNDTNFVSNLRTLSSSINIYYGYSGLAPGNAYLNDQVYALQGGGFLMPAVPEASATWL